MIVERVNQLLRRVNSNVDALNKVDKMIAVCTDYFFRVVEANSYNLTGRYTSVDPEEYRDTAQTLDVSRRNAHQRLVTSIQKVDELCVQSGQLLIYGRDYDDRVATAEFARLLITEYFKNDNTHHRTDRIDTIKANRRRTGSNNLLHYTTNLLALVYPLSTEEYQESSLARRASYDYSVQIIEYSFTSIGGVLSSLNVKPIESQKRRRFLQAQNERILTPELVNAIIELIRKRNLIVHENVEIDDTLAIYGDMIMFILVGYTMFNILSQCDIAMSSNMLKFDGWTKEVVLDKNYLSSQMTQNINSERDLIKAQQRLEQEKRVPTFRIDLEELTNRVLER
jgi:uncharacterized protein YutE (UPF0331/DUF86 family)